MKKLFQLLLVTLSLALFALLSPVAIETTSAHAAKIQTPSFAHSVVTLQSRNSRSSLTASVAHATVHGCPYEYLCLYSDINFGGSVLKLYKCEFVNLGNLDFPGGGKWNDKVSSWVNNQTSNTLSTLYNWDGSGSWVYVDSSRAYADNSWVGWYNDTVDAVQVC